MVNQILRDTERNVKLNEEHLENIDVHSKHLANENHSSDAAHEDIDRIVNDEEIIEPPELRVNANQEKELAPNVIRDETDYSIISKNNDNGDETKEAECTDKNSMSVTEELSHLENTNMTSDQEVNPQPEQKEDNRRELSDSEVVINGTSHSADRLSDSGAWTYKE